MAKYMAILEANPGAFKGMIQEPQDRKKIIEPMFAAIGGTVEHYWLGVGSNMVYVVCNFSNENDIDLEAISMLVFSSGIASSMNMVKLMTSEEAVGAMKRQVNFPTNLLATD